MQIIDKDDNVIEFKDLEEEEDKEDTLRIEEIDAEASIKDGEIRVKGEELSEMPKEDYEDVDINEDKNDSNNVEEKDIEVETEKSNGEEV